MFTFYLQLLDLINLRQIGLFLVFFWLTWSFWLIRLVMASGFTKTAKKANKKFLENNDVTDTPLNLIIPVVDEPLDIWSRVLKSIDKAISSFSEARVVVVANGGNGRDNAKMAKDMGFDVVRLRKASKRKAIEAGVKHLKDKRNNGESITIILDSDTIVPEGSIEKLIVPFTIDEEVGGVTPKHEIFDRGKTFSRHISDWLEDIRFNEVLPGQTSVDYAVSCLPGRLLAIRTHLLEKAVPALVKQKFLGAKCISGDDRFLTSWLLERNYKCIYEPSSVVYTNAPNTMIGFLKQRLRWSRTSMRESVRSIPWTLKYPYTTFTVFGNILTKWLFFAVVVGFILFLSGFREATHYINISTSQLIGFTMYGYLISGIIRHFGHLKRYPKDILYLVPFLLISTFLLTPVEWYGNLSLKESGWMTRDVQ